MLQRLRVGIRQICDGEVVSWAFHFHHSPSFPTREELGLDYATPLSHLTPAHACTLLFFLFSLFGAGFLSPVFYCQQKQIVTKTPHATPCGFHHPRLVPPMQLAQSPLPAPPAPDVGSDPTALLLRISQ